MPPNFERTPALAVGVRRLDAALTKDSRTHYAEAENLTGSRTKSAEEKINNLRPTRNVRRNRKFNLRIDKKD